MNKIRIVIFILIIIWCTVVFNLSGQSGEESSGLSRKIAELIFKNKDQIESMELIIRKIAHFCEYALGGILFCLFFLTYKLKKWKIIVFPFILGVLYAVFDEIHQMFVPGRVSSINDVLIDSAGVLFGILIILVIYKIGKKASVS